MSLTTVSILATSASAIEITSPTHAVDIAGKQRMFTQRMLKDYAMVGMGNTFGKPGEDLKKISGDFQDHMESLAAYTKSDEVKKSIEKVEALWTPLKQTLSEAPSKEKVEKLQVDLDALLKAADDTTKLFAKESGKASGETVNKAGRQRMLSQRMASLYMLKVWEVEDPQFKTKLDDAMKLFKTSLAELEKSSLNTDEIKTLLAKVKRSFMFFEMMSKSKSKFVPTLIYKKSNDILVNMNSATQKYVALETK
ncbi:type IV pili methyl-accepting chemotaxis transducer N-terminal domain-containing protein [Sulfurovum sp. CS9]|uniref:type IV pili methyl-accepting chemotaxis transducer N-terminal domain-containing protein n=1 Tax=Sulfurovum sp. CS9 TaxID=3391146 RepID=UPI0039ECF49E